jgi:hypothetical protein
LFGIHRVHTRYTLDTHLQALEQHSSFHAPSVQSDLILRVCARARVRTKCARTFVEFKPRLAVECGDDKRVPKGGRGREERGREGVREGACVHASSMLACVGRGNTGSAQDLGLRMCVLGGMTYMAQGFRV